MKRDPRVLILATSRKTRGGITAVVKAHETGEHWKQFHCHWVQTHRDGASWRKILYFISGLLNFLVRIPFYDIVHIHTADYGTEKRKRIFARLTKLFKKKLIVHLHSSGAEFSIGGEYRELYRYSFTHADKIILLSNSWLEEAKMAFPECSSKMELLYNPCPSVKPSDPDEREKYVLYAGTLIHRKGYDDLIKAFGRIAPLHPDWRLKLAGNGEIEEGMRLAESLGISNQVDFLGWINGDQKEMAFRHAAIYCLPSYSEGFPMGVLDAWAYHLPVVATPVGGIVDVALDGENLMIYNVGDIEGLSEALNALISDRDKYKHIEEASKTFASGMFSINSISNQLSDIYRNL